MGIKTVVVGAAAVAAAGMLAAAPAASADETGWNPGNCPKGAFCVWADYHDQDTTTPPETPSLVTYGEWAGNVPALTFYNDTSSAADLKWSYTFPDGTTRSSSYCVSRLETNIFYIPVTVTNVTPHNGSC
ncbi:hypothetical protein [Amycolatopsis pithecellobii]|uniref:Peptidase inhibitor family I36 protein n=1 Tax=Amycolatopsis pithecellobii TaxID=664692 RepID=A0A6N7Z0B3_9PSEU|nr:hypothetical protein [Amycolatopsis pithecellobii]MTD57692.1 hypothetical protein [Amycolatopsis pithecellobii]